MPCPRRFTISLILLIALAISSGLAARLVGARPAPSTGGPQTATLFAVSAQVGESTNEVFRYQVTAAGGGKVLPRLTPADVGPTGFVVIFAHSRSKFARPFFRVPDAAGRVKRRRGSHCVNRNESKKARSSGLSSSSLFVLRQPNLYPREFAMTLSMRK